MRNKEQWEKAKKADRCDVPWCQQKAKEVGGGNYCIGHYLHLPSCSNEDCDNPVVVDSFLANGLCRECMFDYTPVVYYQGFGNSAISSAAEKGFDVSGVRILDKLLDDRLKQLHKFNWFMSKQQKKKKVG